MSFGWTCSNCTYRHHAPCERCVMCNELRVTRKQMIDFVQGIPIPAPLPNDPSPTKAAPAKQATLNAVFGGAAVRAVPASQGVAVTRSFAAQQSNPYAKKRPASAMGQSHTTGSSTIGTTNTTTDSDCNQTTVLTVSNDQRSAQMRLATETLPTAAAAASANQTLLKPPPSSSLPPIPAEASTTAAVAVAAAPCVSNNPYTKLKPPPEQPTQPTASESTAAGSRPNSSKFHRPGVLPVAKPKQAPEVSTKQRTNDAAEHKESYQYALTRMAYLPGPVPIDPSTANDWIYPESSDYPTRKYQLEISATAILHNTLVSLPTGLGKTLIAAVVMYNYHRWFPTGKVIFLAPTLPLVQQQIKACYDIMGIPTQATAMLTGKTSQDKRLLIWQERSVFFCTPQTVQKDLESGTCPAQDVVCVVLDEAHRAAGKYAYVNVVKYLEHSGAKFRVVGLSATPGANIKAIQKVIDVLGINRIEARHESELAQYTHTRTSEIVIVPQVAASKGIETAMNAIIDPLLNRLRQAGCFQRFGTNNSISCYNIMKESEAYKERTNNESSLLGYFFAAQKFVQIRDFLHKQGVGMVRTKINEMRTTRQMGILSNIVKSPEFATLWEEVTRATCDPNAYGIDSRDRLLNNPKLSKLCEILKEHFERARACSKSSRAIVFSQYRDSVSEIVTVLDAYKPMIRSRHFVGQGKGSTKQQNEEGGGQVQGMNQAEQQTVVREFRSDVYNVLVCTCIGEEGLDIGEVDLIVNFDTLSSPIRSLQRIGRTGRKREGRVVCLVSEGAEEKTMNAAKQKERTLHHALKNPKAFTAPPTVPLFRTEPKLVKRAMNFSQHFRESQVEGVGGTKTTGKMSAARLATNWKLTDDEESQRLNLLRQYAKTHISLDPASQTTLRGRLLMGRGLQLTRGNEKERFVGRIVALLRKVEAPYVVGARPPRVRALGMENEAIDTLFPLTNNDLPSSEWETKSKVNEAVSEEIADPTPAPSQAAVAVGVTEMRNDLALLESLGIFNDDPVTVHCAEADPPMNDGMTQAKEAEPADEQVMDEFCLPTHPDSHSSSSDDDDDDDVIDEGMEKENDFRLPTPPDSLSSSDEEASEIHLLEDELVDKHASSGSVVVEGIREAFMSVAPQQEVEPMHIEDEFRLPSPVSSTTSSTLSDEDCVALCSEAALENDPTVYKDTTVNANEHARPANGVSFHDVEKADEKAFASAPGPEHLAEQKPLEWVDSTRVGVRRPRKNLKVLDDTQDSPASDKRSAGGCDENQKNNRFSLESTCVKSVHFSDELKDTPISLGRRQRESFATVDSFEEFVQPRVKMPKKRLKVLDDTQESQRSDKSPHGSRTLPARRESECDLRDTQSTGSMAGDAGDVVCAVCGSGASPDEDPIILCDGQRGNKNASCDLAVHMTCYSVLEPLQPVDNWFCDPCTFRRSGARFEASCTRCRGGEDDGALKRGADSSWQHVKCQSRPRLCRAIMQAPNKATAQPAVDSSNPPTVYNPYSKANNIGTQDFAAVRKRKRREHFRRFIQEEADCDSEDDMDGDDDEEDDLRVIEEEEALAASSFINDSSQLGYTQDALDDCDPDAHDDALHRELDAEREKIGEFETPLLNRRFLRKKRDGKWSDTPPSAPSSQKGLGNMHFIRSVLEHHRHGGQAEDIEQAYQELEEEAGEIEEENLIPQPPPPQRQTIYYAGSESEADWD